MAEPRRNVEVPARIGRYRVLRELASGGMGKVFIAQRDGDPGICVLKKLHVEMELHHTAGLRFQREAQLASLLNHPNIARVNRSGVEDSKFCIEMEYIAGHTVAEVMRALLEAGRLPPYELSVNVLLGVLDAVEYAHDLIAEDGRALEIVHRDLTPRNIMLSYEGEVKVIDFGIARGRVDDFRTAPGSIFGTMTYASPEQATGQEVDRRSDLYTLGAVLFELLTGRPLVIESKFEDVLRVVTREVAPRITTLNPDAPKALEPIVARALEKEPARRFQTAAEFSQSLRSAAGALANPVPDLIGEFMMEWFPEQEEKTQAGILRRGPQLTTLEPTQVGGASESATVVRRRADAEEDLATRVAGVGNEGTLVIRNKGSRLPRAPEEALPTAAVAVVAPPKSKLPIFAVGGVAVVIGVGVLLFATGKRDPLPNPNPEPRNEAPVGATAAATKPPEPPPPEPPPPPPPPKPPEPKKAAPPPPKRETPPPPEPPKEKPPEESPAKAKLKSLRRQLASDPANASFDRIVEETQKVAASLPADKAREAKLRVERANNTLDPDKLLDAVDYVLSAAK